ncbi:DUF6273 domain-containing protein [uncultured Vagococcus sp.]|uniref:DUF6273 domain-containing protein n=1 Tax=uncultured Vagococcus sp. TaxID=189676 RepID=UPI0028D3D6B7|nr:DUF6273 domain-containing protein [uncultured Vagococcus sp.]
MPRLKMFFLLVTNLFVCIILAGCEGKAETLRELSYDVSKKTDNEICIKENGFFTPYLVLTEDYEGCVLLLRKYLLDDTRPFKKNDSHSWSYHDFGAYYEESSIDSFLNKEFIGAIDSKVKESIVLSHVVISSKSNFGTPKRDTHTIPRKIFLLSLTELTGKARGTSAPEGSYLRYFKDDYRRRFASFSNGEACPYWTRQPEFFVSYSVFTMGTRGYSSGGADIGSGVRPAFCLPPSVPVVLSDEAVEGKSVYIMKEEE